MSRSRFSVLGILHVLLRKPLIGISTHDQGAVTRSFFANPFGATLLGMAKVLVPERR